MKRNPIQFGSSSMVDNHNATGHRLPKYFLDNRGPFAVLQTTGPVLLLHPFHAVTGDSLKQPNFGPDFGIEIAAFNANLKRVRVTRSSSTAGLQSCGFFGEWESL